LNLLALKESDAVAGGAVVKLSGANGILDAVCITLPPSFQEMVMSVVLVPVGIPPPKQFI
jgi:hypothetical protein